MISLFTASCQTFDWAALGRGLQAAAEIEQAQSTMDSLYGSIVIAEDGTFLGKITNRYDLESIFNEYGQYGSKYSSNSIWNEYGNYGSKFSTYSPFNQYSSSPPAIYKNGILIGYLTVNKYIAGAINPYVLKSYF
jgi:hypothetical protein